MGAGYYGRGPMRGVFVPKNEALAYALERCGVSLTNPNAPEHEEFKAMLEEWLFSDDWKEWTEEDECEKESCLRQGYIA